ncbi:hypothetical protein QZH41_000997 [Actinostola sp. cb2023]|nr:hypothetical protein QZH41_000997 [Actinostola sp. cb2023]
MAPNCTQWEDGELAKAIHKLCVTQDPDVRLTTLTNGSLLTSLRIKKIVTTWQPQPQRTPYGIPFFKNRAKRSIRRQRNVTPLFHLCEEYPGSVFVLVDDNDNLVYQVKTVQCGDGCYIASRRFRIGDCVTKKKTIELLVSDGCNGLKPRTIEVGCNCECMKNVLFL